MKKLLFACAMTVAGAFAFAGASPASAMTAGPVTGLSDIAAPGATVDKVGYYRRDWCWRYPWRCGHRRGYYGRPYRRDYYGGHGYRHRHHRPWWW